MNTKEKIEEFLSNHPRYRNLIDNYSPDQEVIERIRIMAENISVKVFFGEWCPDCIAQIPIFLDIILALKTGTIDLDFIELNRSMDDGFWMAKKYNVLAIPTFILTRGGKEIGRIIEKPKNKMEMDIVEILE